MLLTTYSTEDRKFKLEQITCNYKNYIAFYM